MKNTMKTIYQLLLMAGLTLSLVGLSQAVTMYKWVDKDGNVHYAQDPPDNSNYQTLNIQAQSSGGDLGEGSSSSKPTYSSPNTSSNSNDNTSAVIKQQEAKGEAQRQKNCEIAKKALTQYTEFRRFRQKDGTVIRMDDNKRAQLIEKSKQEIQEFCQ